MNRLGSISLKILLLFIALIAGSGLIVFKQIPTGSNHKLPIQIPLSSTSPSLPTTTPNSPSTPPILNAEVVHITQGMMGQTVYVKVGAVLYLDYENNDLGWTDQYDKNLLQRAGTRQLKAVTVGSTELQSTGNPCTNTKAGVPCPQFLVEFNINVVISN